MTGAGRPTTLVAVLGTGTEVGKTWVSAHALTVLHDLGRRVSARKPAQSYDPDDPSPTDAEVLAAATGERPATVCPPSRCYEVAMAPPMAAEALGLAPFSGADLLADMAPWADGTDVGLVETAGGPRSPIAADTDSLGLVRRLQPDVVVLVADAGLGTINAVLLCLEAAGHAREWVPVEVPGERLVVALNRFDGSDLHVRNRDWLIDAGFPVVTNPMALADRI